MVCNFIVMAAPEMILQTNKIFLFTVMMITVSLIAAKGLQLIISLRVRVSLLILL